MVMEMMRNFLTPYTADALATVLAIVVVYDMYTVKTANPDMPWTRVLEKNNIGINIVIVVLTFLAPMILQWMNLEQAGFYVTVALIILIVYYLILFAARMMGMDKPQPANAM